MIDANQLMARVRARDARSFEALYDAFGKLVHGVALRMLGNAATAEDVTQSVFLKVWTSPDLYRGGSFASWIVRVTRNRCLDVLRKDSKNAAGEIPEDLPEAEILEEQVTLRIDAERARSAMAQLPAEQRTPIELGFFDGLTHEQIAARLDVPLGTIKTRIRAGLHKLRASLEDARR